MSESCFSRGPFGGSFFTWAEDALNGLPNYMRLIALILSFVVLGIALILLCCTRIAFDFVLFSFLSLWAGLFYFCWTGRLFVELLVFVCYNQIEL